MIMTPASQPHTAPLTVPAAAWPVLVIPLASCRPAAPTRQICQHLEHGSQDDYRKCRIESQINTLIYYFLNKEKWSDI